jgi:putative tricarboxylic transport membrane protein
MPVVEVAMNEDKLTLSMQQRGLLMGILLLLLAVVSYFLTYHFSGSDFEEIPFDVGPQFLPRILLLALAVESMFLILMSAGKKKDYQKKARQELEPLIHARPIIMLAAFLAYVYLATLFGYVVSTIAFLVIGFYMLGVKKIWLLLILPPLITAATYFLFETLLNIYLPSGNLF